MSEDGMCLRHWEAAIEEALQSQEGMTDTDAPGYIRRDAYAACADLLASMEEYEDLPFRSHEAPPGSRKRLREGAL